MVSQKKHSYTVSGSTTVDGAGNYMLNMTAPIARSWGDANDTVFRMFFLDSSAEALTEKYPYVFSEYDWIKQSQVVVITPNNSPILDVSSDTAYEWHDS